MWVRKKLPGIHIASHPQCWWASVPFPWENGPSWFPLGLWDQVDYLFQCYTVGVGLIWYWTLHTLAGCWLWDRPPCLRVTLGGGFSHSSILPILVNQWALDWVSCSSEAFASSLQPGFFSLHCQFVAANFHFLLYFLGRHILPNPHGSGCPLGGLLLQI